MTMELKGLLVGVKAILAYLSKRHGIRIHRTAFWEFRQPGPAGFPTEVRRFGRRATIIADPKLIDAWVRDHWNKATGAPIAPGRRRAEPTSAA